MSLVSQVVAALTGGVSKQPPAYRSPAQAEEMINCDATVASGLQKRLPTLLVQRLMTENLQRAFVHFVDNPAGRYVMVFTGQAPNPLAYTPTVRIFNLFGVEQSFPQTASDTTYFTTPDPKRDLRAITVGDFTIVVNRLRVVEFADTTVSNTFQEVQSFASLPAPNSVTPVGYYKVLGDQANGFGAYWVTKGGTGGNSAWVETAIPALNNYIDVTTLPRWFFRNPTTGAWGIRPFNDTWRPRLVGDKFMSPLPSIAGKTIQDVFFYRNRLGYVTADTIVMSRSGEPTNFFPRSMLSVRDDDPIDFALAFPKSSVLRYAVPFNRSLILFAERGQYIVSAEGALSPRTIRADILTEFEASAQSRPVVMGPNLYFCQPSVSGTTVREMYIGQDAIITDATDVTSQCPGYLAGGITEMRASSTHDIMVLGGISAGEIAVFRTKWEKDRRIQQAWFKWNLGSRFLLGTEFFDDSLFFVLADSSGVYLERMDFQLLGNPQTVPLNTLPGGSAGKRWPISLDRLQVASGAAYDAATDTTLFNLSVPISVDTPIQVIQSDGNNSGSLWEVFSRPSTTQVRVRGERTDGFLWYVGVPYTARYTFSPIFVRSENGTPRLNGRLQLRRMRVCLADSSYLRVEVTPEKRDTLVRTFLADSESGTFGSVRMEDRNLDLAIQSDARTVKIEFVNDTPYPSRIYAVEWTGYYHNRNRSS